MFEESTSDFRLGDDTDGDKDEVDGWIDEIRPDAEFNLSSYSDIYLSENIIRRFVDKKGDPITPPAQRNIDEYRRLETRAKQEAGIAYDIRHQDDDLNYLDLKSLAFNAEHDSMRPRGDSLHGQARMFKPMRDALAHTSRLTADSKAQLGLVLSNIKARVRSLLSEPTLPRNEEE